MTEDLGAWDFFVGESVAVSLDIVGDSVAILFGALVGILVFFPFLFVLVGAPVMSKGEGEGREDTESDGVLVMEEVLGLKVGASVLTGQVEHVSLQTSWAGK